METRVEMHHMRYQNKGKAQFYEMLSLDLENGLYIYQVKGVGKRSHLYF